MKGKFTLTRNGAADIRAKELELYYTVIFGGSLLQNPLKVTNMPLPLLMLILVPFM